LYSPLLIFLDGREKQYDSLVFMFIMSNTLKKNLFTLDYQIAESHRKRRDLKWHSL